MARATSRADSWALRAILRVGVPGQQRIFIGQVAQSDWPDRPTLRITYRRKRAKPAVAARVHALIGRRYAICAGTPSDWSQLPSGEQMDQDFTKLARVEVRNLDPCETFVSAGCNGLLRHGAIGPIVRQYYDAKLARGLRKGGKLISTASVMRLESP